MLLFQKQVILFFFPLSLLLNEDNKLFIDLFGYKWDHIYENTWYGWLWLSKY